jgi:hypothetical protein
MKPWMLREVKFIKANLHLTDKQIALFLKRSTSGVQMYRHRHGLLKPNNGRFHKQQSTWNKGKHYQAGGRSLTTQFKKGQVSHNKKYSIGDVYEMADGKGGRRMYIKLLHNKQYPYAWYVWEQHTSDSMNRREVIVHRDGNLLNCSFSNLEKISRGELTRRTTDPKNKSEGLRKAWAVVRAFEDYGLTPPYKFRSKKRSA